MLEIGGQLPRRGWFWLGQGGPRPQAAALPPESPDPEPVAF
jgi:hypothetical protein